MTDIRRWTGALVLAWFSVVAAAPLRAEAQEVHRLSGAEVAVYNLAGAVRVVAGTGAEVVVRTTRGGRDGARLTVETDVRGGVATLRVVYPESDVVYPALGRGNTAALSVRPDGTFGGRGGGGSRVQVRGQGGGMEAWADLVVEVPAGRRTAVHLAAGPLEARGVTGDVELRTSTGGVTVAEIMGRALVDTGSGRVSLDGVRGDVSVDTGSGAIAAARLTGGAIRLDTGSGAVTVDGAEARSVHVDTGSGRVRLSGVRSPVVEVDTGSGSVDVELLTDASDVSVDTGSGSVTVRVPTGFGAEVDVETGSGRIEVDVPVEIRTARRDVFRGRIGDGAGTLSIDTGSGGVRILGGG